ncbi:YceI family protein [Albimonas pacifica]|uniref:Polyisoprenoid-binding protein YceI n=1 Tax=Albimonas pacifica TaxID=1114924 RepID=A0A1I3MMA3_9RHOB|nr:YceI family protein [Albimonas pacifica]SFI98254.1 Polyisoprenoid-binding protein YceI [Albimonas pacifica]
MRARGADLSHRARRALPRRLGAALLVAGSAAAPAAAADWEVDHAASRLSISVEVAGRRLFGEFQDWRAEIAFDPENPEACRVRVEVDVASLAFPDDMASSSAAEPEWLAAAAHPVAVFEGEGFSRSAPGDWTVHGVLTVKGETRPLDLEVAIAAEGDAAEANVAAELVRSDYGVGGPVEEMVGLSVRIDAHVVARRLD